MQRPGGGPVNYGVLGRQVADKRFDRPFVAELHAIVAPATAASDRLRQLTYQLLIRLYKYVSSFFIQDWQTQPITTASVILHKNATHIHCVQKKTPTHIFFHISMNDV